MKRPKQRFNRKKFAALVHYVISKLKSAEYKKLACILFFVDFHNYAETGRSMTGETYRKAEMGVQPDHLNSVLDELLRKKKIAVKLTDKKSREKSARR